ncbi:hypothetical protein RIF29_45990 [Crotalaria pallida]|uniref:Uncharacterized protein n=1 Tax=Crotalaria pallida TaxID=3830 RepID=A0AAN9DSQ6_CROPI
MLTRSAKVTSFRVTNNRAVNETASLQRPAFGKKSASALRNKIKKELVPLLATDLEGILDKTFLALLIYSFLRIVLEKQAIHCPRADHCLLARQAPAKAVHDWEDAKALLLAYV